MAIWSKQACGKCKSTAPSPADCALWLSPQLPLGNKEPSRADEVLYASNPQCCSLSTRTLERIVCALMFAMMPLVANLDWHYVARMHSLPEIHFLDGACYEYSSDTRVLLAWIANLTASHFFMNLRWFVLLPVEFAGGPVESIK